MPKASRYHRGHAFTLIECLVAISLIALLVAILLPALSSARDSARAVLCASNLRQVGLAFVMYRDDYKEYLPYTYSPGSIMWGTGHLAPYIGLRPPQDSTEANYYGSQGILECPADPTDFENIYVQHNRRAVFEPSYGMNHRLAGRNVEQRLDTIEKLLVADSSHRWEVGGSGTGYLIKNDDIVHHVYPRHASQQVANLLWVGGHVTPSSDVPGVNNSGSKVWSSYNVNDDPSF